MDSFINLAKQGYSIYQESHSSDQPQENVHRTGGHEYNSPHHSQQDGNQGHPAHPQIDEDEVVNTASTHGSGDSSLFSSALDFVKSNKHQHSEPVDEEHVTNAHREAYEQENASNMSAGSIGSAAAMQALKSFTGGSGGGSGGSSQLISMAMAEASKLFDKSGGGSSGSKQDAVNGAAMTVMKLLVQSKFSSMTGGGNSGGLGGMMSLASKFI